MLKIYNDKEFIKRVCDADELVLFGAGKRLFDVEKFFKNTNIPDKVSAIIDNDRQKQGTVVSLWGKDIEIAGLSRLSGWGGQKN